MPPVEAAGAGPQDLADIKAAFPHLDPALVGHDIAYPAMLKFLPVGFAGLMVGGLIAANSSTLLRVAAQRRSWPRRFETDCDAFRAPLFEKHPAELKRARSQVVVLPGLMAN